MKDRRVRTIVKNSLGAGLILFFALCAAAFIWGGKWYLAAVAMAALLPLARLDAEIYAFFKIKKPLYAVLAAAVFLTIILSFIIALL